MGRTSHQQYPTTLQQVSRTTETVENKKTPQSPFTQKHSGETDITTHCPYNRQIAVLSSGLPIAAILTHFTTATYLHYVVLCHHNLLLGLAHHPSSAPNNVQRTRRLRRLACQQLAKNWHSSNNISHVSWDAASPAVYHVFPDTNSPLIPILAVQGLGTYCLPFKALAFNERRISS